MLTATLLFAVVVCRNVEGPFRDLSVDEALATAKRDNKVVMIDFFTTWCPPCKKLDAVTWKDPAVVAWLGESTVALKLDAEKEVELAQRHRISAYPTMLFLKADGSELDRIVGYREPAEFLSQAKDALAGKNAVARAKESLAGREKDPMARGAYADELARAARYEEALVEYLWCFDHGAEESPAYSGVRVSFLVSDIAQLGRIHPPATKALEDRRDAAESRLLGGSGSDDDVSVAAAINKRLNAPKRTLALYDGLRSKGPLSIRARTTLSDEVLPLLVEERRYQDALDLFDHPEGFVFHRVERANRGAPLDLSQDEEMKKAMEMAKAMARTSAVTECANVHEALLGTGKAEPAAKIADALIQLVPNGRTYVTLVESAVRAGNLEVARSLAERGLKELPEKEQKRVRRAQGRIPASK